MSRHRNRDDRTRGQALVEFSLVIVPFLVILMACVDLGRAIYQMNGTSEAAREIARVASVHPYSSCTSGSCDIGSSTEVQGVVSTQRNLIPSLQVNTTTDIACVEQAPDGTDTIVPDNTCRNGDYFRVTVRSQFTPVTPVVMLFGSHTFTATSRIKWP
jgi:Flp pilus assembly protein TadG